MTEIVTDYHCQNCMLKDDCYKTKAPSGKFYWVCFSCTELVEDGEARCVKHNEQISSVSK